MPRRSLSDAQLKSIPFTGGGQKFYADGQLPGFQEPVFKYAVQVALAFSNPSLTILRRIIEPRPFKSTETPYHQQVIHKLHPTIQHYLSNTFEVEGVRRSRSEIMNRLYSLSADPIFRRLFESEETKIHLSKEIADGKVIVINASRDYLHELKELYGRYFLGLVKAAGERRPANSSPCFIYIDECDEFVANDNNAADILFKLRRKRMALILGNQDVARIKIPRTAFLGTAIKMVNSDPDSADEIAKTINLPANTARQHFVGRPGLNFAYHIRGRMPEPVAFKVPFGVMEAMPKMTEEEWQQVRQEIREKYYVPVNRTPVPPAPEPSLVDMPIVEAPIEKPQEPKPLSRPKRKYEE